MTGPTRRVTRAPGSGYGGLAPFIQIEADLLVTFFARIISGFRHAVWSVKDVLPPYRTVEGYLETKVRSLESGKHFIWVASTRIEVDAETFELLIVGENMRVMCTKSYRAINIDRLIPGSGPG